MKFSYLIAIIAVTTMGLNALAADGTLRRQVAQNDDSASSGVVILNTNTATNTNGNNAATASQAQTQTSDQAQAQKAVAQPTTIVEASPVTESRAEALRKARVDAEVQTEQKIVEKLEGSRLDEEKARADRLFGNKLDPQPVQQQVQQQQQTQTTTTTTVVTPIPPVPVETKATNVTIEKVEIVQPKEEKKEEPKIEKIEPIAPPMVVKTEIAPEPAARKASFYVSGGVGNLAYNANNVKSNYGLGVSVGTILDDRFAVELGYFYSNHYINTYWNAPLYNQLDQHDISASAKYLIIPGKFRPYVGASMTYISRTYTDRVKAGSYYSVNQSDSESTNAVNMGLLGGVEFQLSDNFMIGAGLEYNFNVFNTSEPDWVSSYSLPAGTTPLEKISYSALKISAKFIF